MAPSCVVLPESWAFVLHVPDIHCLIGMPQEYYKLTTGVELWMPKDVVMNKPD